MPCESLDGLSRNWDPLKGTQRLPRVDHFGSGRDIFSFYFGCIDQIAVNLTKRKEFLNPISLDNINIMQDWVVEEENLLDKDDFDMD